MSDFFAERVAGNIANEDIIGRLEWASKVASSKLIAVCGDYFADAIRWLTMDCKFARIGTL